MTNRRQLLKGLALTGAGLSAGVWSGAGLAAQQPLHNRVRHSVARWTFGDMDIESLCQAVKKIGFSAIDLVGPQDWPVLKKYGIDSAMCNGAELNLTDGWCEPEFHDQLIERYRHHIDLVAEAGYRNLVCFSGNKRGMDPQAGLDNAAKGLSSILGHAEKRGVVLHMELFNAIDHPDYMADNSAWGVALCRRLQSPNFKLLYDIYHMQVNEGNIIQTIQDNIAYFGHFHTAGVPGRHEIDDSQELNYRAIVKAIHSLNFEGYVAQEFIPTANTQSGRLAALQQAVKICDV